jgi:hypothetical protein
LAGFAIPSKFQSEWLYTRWEEITEILKFKYLYTSYCKSYKLLWVLWGTLLYEPLKSPQQFAGFAVTLVRIFKF